MMDHLKSHPLRGAMTWPFVAFLLLWHAVETVSGAAPTDAPSSPIAGPVTFTRDVASILFSQCSGCHRPGQAAPFPLLSYDDARKHAKQIAEVTHRRYMPPWLPDTNLKELEGERKLTDQQIEILQAWAAQGMTEGSASDLPPLPKWTDGWQLGPPDLIVTMAEPYTLTAEGKDIYRNFVIPVPLMKRRYVRAIEFNPGNYRIVHHAFVSIDSGRVSRALDARDPEPGFEGIHTPTGVRPPDGFFLSWQPGKRPYFYRDGFGWPLEPDSDLVLQVHMQPSGKPEKLQASVGLYFSEKPPTQRPFKIWLSSYDVDIPAGETNYVVRDSYKLSADADVLSILPHAHFLGHEMKGYATLPDGTRRWLFRIKSWDFNWQGDYRFVTPVFLPKDSTIFMEFSYDNSTNNIRNPNFPPQRVRYGPQSSDEMAELWLQLLPRTPEGRGVIERDYQKRVYIDSLAFNNYLLSKDPSDAQAHRTLGRSLFVGGKIEEAVQHLQEAMRLDPKDDEAHYTMGLLKRSQAKTKEAENAFKKAITLNPKNARAHGNLALVLLQQNRIDDGEKHFLEAARLNPRDALALDMLGMIRLEKGDSTQAAKYFRQALAEDPTSAEFRQHLEMVDPTARRVK